MACAQGRIHRKDTELFPATTEMRRGKGRVTRALLCFRPPCRFKIATRYCFSE